MSRIPNTGPDHRRKWNLSEYTRRQQDDDDDEEIDDDDGKLKKMPAEKKEMLKARDYKIDLESRVGKSVVVTKTTHLSQAGGYYCEVCECVVKDSINFLDHVNGKKHQKNLGMSMKIERSTLDQVKKRFEMNKQKKEQQQQDYKLDERIKEIKEEEERIKNSRKENIKKKRKAEQEADEAEVDDEMAKLMGFSGFASGKKPKSN